MNPSLLLIALWVATAPASQAGQNPIVCIRTELGVVVVQVAQDKASKTAANFLSYVDAKRYDGAVFHRAVTMANQPTDEVKIEVIQGGQLPAEKCFAPIPPKGPP